MIRQSKMALCKGKRSKRPRASPPRVAVYSSSSGSGDGGSMFCPSVDHSQASSSSQISTEEDEDVAHCLILLARGGPKAGKMKTASTAAVSGGYECKTCNRIFPSFQALGGHRASHNKKQSTSDHQESRHKGGGGGKTEDMRSNRIHGCSICGSEFFSGQALGGHMRRHRPLHMNGVTVSTTKAAASSSMDDDDQEKPATGFTLDLNLPAPGEDQAGDDGDGNSMSVSSVFSGPDSLDCHY
ncbi:unnamed protein product [Cuscuta europaea]|uniref:C2H2-type domain-containing protein n=1 Tax=Cuscuta europaea TaxID=41803 RepID=A0A9P1ENI3_CUSEU|nr:unnamed protein product [Cuscuta europaea]